MIPLKLELKNFMSYGAEGATLDMTGLHTLCLAGENGNGKSALLDAMTWALWGESRAGKNRHDDLVRIGADEMSVTLTFEMDGQTYRVLRKRSKRASGNVWQIYQQKDDGAWHSLTGDDSRKTEQAIQKLLRMSYDTFLNSAYLRQGQADHFVQQTPSKRKQILADILDLGRYDALEALARDKAKAAAADAVDLERDLNSIGAELAQEAVHVDAISALQAQLAELNAHAVPLRAEHDAIMHRLSELGGMKTVADSLHVQLDNLARELADLHADRAALEREIADASALLSRREAISKDYTALQEARARAAQLEQDVAQLLRGRLALANAQREHDTAENLLRTRVAVAEEAHREAVQSVKELPSLTQERDAIAAQMAAFDTLAREQATLEQSLPDAQDKLTLLKEEDARLGEQSKVWEERLAALARQQGVCAVCSADLTKERQIVVREEYQAALDDLAARRKDGRSEGARAKSELTALQSRLAEIKLSLRDARDIDRRLAQIEQKLLEMQGRASDVPKKAAHLAEETAHLQGGNFAPEVRARIDKIQRGLERYVHAEADYAQVKAEMGALDGAERLHQELGHAETALGKAQARLARVQALGMEREAARTEAEKQLSGLADVAGEIAARTQRRDELRALELSRKRQEGEVNQEIGSHGRALEHCAALKVTRDAKTAALADARKSEEMHKQLTQAFGKKGVQALIIENALPELQDEANRLLDRLTDGDMSLYIDTLEEGKSKRTGPVETLKIKVSDSLGTRPLEMYSGGEGFRAAFALRISLSKLLARRAGAKLQTLIIDEGFGTQDGKGREKLVEALSAIGSDFEKIIVITHIDELKDSFPARVEVTKTPRGSQITLMEGGAG